jgi:hypothetical protein
VNKTSKVDWRKGEVRFEVLGTQKSRKNNDEYLQERLREIKLA